MPSTDNLTDTNELNGIITGNQKVINMFIAVKINDIISINIGILLLTLFILAPSLQSSN